MATKPYSFPPIKYPEILQCLHFLQIQATENDLLHPENNREQYLRMMEQLAEVCTSISRDEMIQPAFSGLTVLSYPEMHEESVAFLNTFRACSKMMEICGITNFTIRDFTTPNAKRLLKQLSGIINFVKFREDRLGLLQDLNASRDGLLDRLQKAKDKFESSSNRLSLLREQTSEESKIIARLENECKDIETQISRLNAQQADIREESAELKARNNDLKESIASRSLQLEECINLRKKLTGQIVSSPEKFRKQITDVAQSLQTEQKDAKVAEKRVRELSVWIGNVEEAQAEVDAALDSIQELRAEVTRQKGVLGELDAVKQDSAAKRQALVELDQNLNHTNRQASRAEEKLGQLRRQAGVRSVDLKTTIDLLHSQIGDAENIRAQIKARAERADADYSRMEKDVEVENENQEKEKMEMIQSYQKLEHVVMNHLSSLNRSLEMNATKSLL